MYCTNCSNQVSSLKSTCEYCGDRANSNINYCYNCGAENTNAYSKCTSCGTRIMAKQNYTVLALLLFLTNILNLYVFYAGKYKEGAFRTALLLIATIFGKENDGWAIWVVWALFIWVMIDALSIFIMVPKQYTNKEGLPI
ncbi:hypothetical protein OAP32_02580 [Crocinitomicaceae bacterium]|nr:hypothetical protein [Crocinitomicaceae bacterium]